MDSGIKSIFHHHLSQLDIVVAKIPPELFSATLIQGMLSLEMNAKIAANFALRGYCPLVDQAVVSFFKDESGKHAVQAQLSETIGYLDELPDVDQLDDTKRLTDKAGFSDVDLHQSVFIHQYIVPNMLFHLSMVYATARAQGVDLSKGDYDGFHSYPEGFSFV